MDEAEAEREEVELLGELVRLNNELVTTQRELERRTAELERRTVELERANAYKNQLLGMAAHDLRNPIGAIGGLAGTVRRRAADRLDDRERLVLERIEHSSLRMLEIVNDLLSLTDLDRGGLALRRGHADLVEIVTTSVELARVVAEQKGIEIALESPLEELPLDADAGKLEQVVENLVTNAIKYSPPGEQVVVSLEASGDEATLRVRDHGVGIPPEEHDRIFEPFNRSSPSPTAGESSTGLGLAIVRAIVTAHGGTIDVESTPGQGSTFTVTLHRTTPDG